MWRSRLLRKFIFVCAICGTILVLGGLVLQQQLAKPQTDVRHLRLLLWFFIGLATLLVLLTGFLHARIVSPRIRRVLSGMEEIRLGKYPRLLAEGEDEVAKLIRGFNETVEELRSRDEKLKSWAGRRETELFRLSQSLEQERERFGTVLDSIGDGVVVLDGENKVLMANRRVSEIFGVAAESLAGAELGTLVEQVSHRLIDRAMVEEKVRDLYKSPGDVHEITLQLDDPAGQAIRLYCAPVRGADGSVLSRIATSIDLGKEREFDRLKAELITTLSHELRTPLTSLKGSLGLIQSGAVGVTPPEIRELLDVAVTNTDQLVHLTGEILDHFPFEDGQRGLRRVPVSLSGSCTQVKRVVASQAERRKVEIEMALPEDLPSVHGDPKRVEQVLLNLLSSAIKRSAPGQRVILSARAEDRKVIVSVQDFGRVMSKELLERVSGRSEPSQSTNPLAIQDTRLRLDICRRIVDSHGGQLWAESGAERGSLIYFSLPVLGSGETAQESSGAAQEGPSATARLILVVDGDEAAARVVSYVFKRQGYRVISSHSGREAIRLAREHRPDMLTLDMATPDMDGYAVLKSLRGGEETRHIPIVCISTQSDPSRAMSNGADFYLVKPLDMERLRAVAERALATA